MNTRTHLRLAVGLFILVGGLLVVAAWATPRHDFTPCHQAVEDLRRASTKDDARRVLERHRLPVVEEKGELTAICRGTPPSSSRLHYYPVMATYVQINADAQQRVSKVQVDDVLVINGIGR